MLNITPLICAQKTSSDHMMISPSPTGEHISQTCRQFYQHFWMLFGVLSNFCTLPANNEARDLFWILFQFLFVNNISMGKALKKWDPVMSELSVTITDRIQLILTVMHESRNSRIYRIIFQTYPQMINSSHIYEKQSLFFVFLFLQGPVV